jgi:uncharacterized protein involved in outer membrane biogenesis
MKKLLTILAVVVIAVLVISFTKDAIIKVSIENGVKAVTGLKLTIRSISVGILKTVVDIKDLKLANPAGFPDPAMIDMPEIYVDYDLPAIMGGVVYLREARLALKEFVVVRDRSGQLNLNALKSVQTFKERKAAPQKAAPGKAPQIKIDVLKLSIGKVIFKDYSTGATPVVKEFNIDLNETYSNIDNPSTLANLIVVKALMKTPIAGLANFDLRGLQGSIGPTLATAQKTVMEAVATAQGAAASAQGAVKSATEQAKAVQDQAKQTADAMKDLFKNPFGSDK